MHLILQVHHQALSTWCIFCATSINQMQKRYYSTSGTLDTFYSMQSSSNRKQMVDSLYHTPFSSSVVNSCNQHQKNEGAFHSLVSVLSVWRSSSLLFWKKQLNAQILDDLNGNWCKVQSMVMVHAPDSDVLSWSNSVELESVLIEQLNQDVRYNWKADISFTGSHSKAKLTIE